MANTFYRKFTANVGNVVAQLGSYTVGANTTTVIVGLSLCNTTGATVNGTVYVNNGTSNVNLVKNAPISSGATLVVIGGDQKIVLQSSDNVYVQSSAVTSIDAFMSIMEIT